MANRTSIAEPSTARKAAREVGQTKPGARMPVRSQAASRPAGQSRVSPEERRRLIAETAYFIAERRGFSAGWELDDWLQAEAEINRRLGGSGSA